MSDEPVSDVTEQARQREARRQEIAARWALIEAMPRYTVFRAGHLNPTTFVKLDDHRRFTRLDLSEYYETSAHQSVTGWADKDWRCDIVAEPVEVEALTAEVVRLRAEEARLAKVRWLIELSEQETRRHEAEVLVCRLRSAGDELLYRGRQLMEQETDLPARLRLWSEADAKWAEVASAVDVHEGRTAARQTGETP